MRSSDRAGVSRTREVQERVTRCRNAKCPLNLSNRIRESGKSALTCSAMDWHSHGFNLPVLDGTRLTPRQNEVFASAKQSR
jgi:hypothetical protein